jgi:mannose-P-dolichol utilization defect protein 1
MAQNVVIAVLVLHFSGKQSAAALFVAGLATSAIALFSNNLIDMKLLSYLQAGAGVLGVASKLPQILAIWQEGGTGQLSAFAVSTSPLQHYRQRINSIAGLQLSHRLALSNFHDVAGS